MSAGQQVATSSNEEELRMLASVLVLNAHNEGNWAWLSRNKNITMEIISAFPRLRWDYRGVCRNPNLTVEFVRRNNSRKPLDWVNISANPAMTPEVVEANLDLPWDFYFMSTNPSLTLEYVMAHQDRDWDMEAVASNPAIMPDPRLSFRAMSRNPNVTEAFIEAHMDKDWDWGFLSSHQNVSLEFIEAHMDKPWDWHTRLSMNPNMTMDFVKKHRARFVIDLPYIVPTLSGLLNEEGDDFNEDGMAAISYGLGANPIVTPELLLKHAMHNGWDWNDLSKNPSISLSFIEEHSEFPWNWTLISNREDITPGFITRNLDKNWVWSVVYRKYGAEVNLKFWELQRRRVRTIGWTGGVLIK